MYTSLASFAESVKAHSCEVLLYFLSIFAFPLQMIRQTAILQRNSLCSLTYLVTVHKIFRLSLGLLTSSDDLWLLPQLFLLLACHDGHQQGDGHKALGAGAQPHKGRRHNDGLAVHHAQQSFLHAQLRGNAPQANTTPAWSLNSVSTGPGQRAQT